MAITRKGLKAMGLGEEQIESIIDAHTETVDRLKDELKTAKADAEELSAVKKELEGLKAAGRVDTGLLRGSITHAVSGGRLPRSSRVGHQSLFYREPKAWSGSAAESDWTRRYL